MLAIGRKQQRSVSHATSMPFGPAAKMIEGCIPLADCGPKRSVEEVAAVPPELVSARRLGLLAKSTSWTPSGRSAIERSCCAAPCPRCTWLGRSAAKAIPKHAVGLYERPPSEDAWPSGAQPEAVRKAPCPACLFFLKRNPFARLPPARRAELLQQVGVYFFPRDGAAAHPARAVKQVGSEIGVPWQNPMPMRLCIPRGEQPTFI